MKALKLAVVQFTPEFGKKKKNLCRMQELVNAMRMAAQNLRMGSIVARSYLSNGGKMVS